MNKKLLLFLAINSVLGTALAEDVVLSRKHDNLESVAQRYFEKIKYKYHSIEEYKNELRKWNTDITNWDDLPKDQILYVYYPYSSYIGEYALPEKEEYESLKSKGNIDFHYNFIYGDYKENSQEEAIASQQSYPISLGLTGEYLINKSNAIELSFDWKSPSKSKIKNVNEEVVENLNDKSSFNGHAYFKKYFLNKDFNVFIGYDLESFDTVNIQELNQTIEVTNTQNTFHFASMGLGYNFYFFNKMFYTQLKYQTSVASKKVESLPVSDFKKNATKMQFLVAYKSYDLFYINAFYNKIDMNYLESSTANISQVGIGVGFDLF